MDRYLFYDEESGAIVHSHQSLRVGSDDLVEPDDETVAMLIGRVAAARPVARLATAEPLVSSARAARRVDVRTGRLETIEADPRFRQRGYDQPDERRPSPGEKEGT